MSVETKIMAALFDRVASFTTVPPLPRAMPNMPAFTPPSSGKYLRVQFMPNRTGRLIIGSTGKHRHEGILQVTVRWPQGTGETGPREVAGSVADHFPADLPLFNDGVRVRITKRPDVADMMVDAVGVMIPVSIEYESFA